MLELLVKGGYLMVPLLVCSVLAIAVLVDRGYAFYIHSKLDTRALRARVIELIGQDRVEEAGALCTGTPSPVSAVLLAGLKAYDKHRRLVSDPDSVMMRMEKAMDDCTQHAISVVEKRFIVLSTVGSAAPLLGMTGTVTGMIASFSELAAAGVESGGVASGISEALITTASGLMIALIALVPYYFFLSKSQQIELEISEVSTELRDAVAEHMAAASQE